MSSFILNLYSDCILSIKRGNGIQGKSKAKPLFVLSIIECISLNLLKQNQIRWDDSNVEKRYNELSNVYDANNKSSMLVPFYHMKSAPFYHLIWNKEEVPAISGHTPSGKYLRENLLYAKLDDELWDLLQNAEKREIIKRKIINNYLTEK